MGAARTLGPGFALWLVFAPRARAANVEFARDVQPILERQCQKCHGPDKQKGNLRLDARESALRLVVPGASRASRLYQVLVDPDPDDRMPRGGDPLTQAQIDLVAAWIDRGAEWPDRAPAAVARHWAYVVPARSAPPPVVARGWPRGALDRFVLARLEKEGLRPSPEAPRATLLRRVSLDLIGLPPTLGELDVFLADRSNDAYEKAVDRLLASPHYGERWARPWLDLARYADTAGPHDNDQPRPIWRYRDWVIDALNRDMPYDEFTVEQIAGDMMPEATPEQRVATGFHRNSIAPDRDGISTEEQRWMTLLDRTVTTASVWLGATFGCARCHDHKYDPFSQREFFQWLAFFENAVDKEIHIGNSTTLVLDEVASAQRPSTLRRMKGSFDRPGERVFANVPRAFGALPDTVMPNRLGLARWLVDGRNPLTARVAVNRAWEQIFGRGLVETTEDLGTQGARPSHPELLDWLAIELVRGGWSMKALHRLIVTSATYRQSSQLTPVLAERDPENRLMARGPRFRMEAEMIRDTTLAASGLLKHKIGGPSVFPPQPEGIWNIPRNAHRWETSQGEDRWRRGIYTFWARVAPYPSFAVFDAPSREVSVSRRTRTNTPLQALTTLNDPAFFEAARALGGRILREAPRDTRARARRGFRLCTSRQAATDEIERLVLLVDTLRAETDEGSAWTLVANVLLNLDETMTKE